MRSLNESPSEKEGKCRAKHIVTRNLVRPSMKVPPKRKGNNAIIVPGVAVAPLNESPSEKEGKSVRDHRNVQVVLTPQ